MTHFSVGDQVIVRFGRQQGQRATVLKSGPGDAYMVKVEDGSVRFYSGKGLEQRVEGTQAVVR
jgi:ribosomal protein L24